MIYNLRFTICKNAIDDFRSKKLSCFEEKLVAETNRISNLKKNVDDFSCQVYKNEITYKEKYFAYDELIKNDREMR